MQFGLLCHLELGRRGGAQYFAAEDGSPSEGPSKNLSLQNPQRPSIRLLTVERLKTLMPELREQGNKRENHKGLGINTALDPTYNPLSERPFFILSQKVTAGRSPGLHNMTIQGGYP